ncbi:FAD-dependent oxidoreductase, partial [Streptomyces geysiriensis]|uniref:FAD-dependent oxidoreductase n=1 Tax=Streptomyces geysiriensis TaxID=68207 RepID=UPI001C7DF9EE
MSPTSSSPAAGASLSAARRSRELTEALGGPVVDVLVVGLGATGAGVALDAAARGLSVVAVDSHDLAFGTSRWSSKLIHGGLRYLASAHLDVAHESAVERGVLMERTAPHLVHAQPFVLPLTPLVSRSQAALAWAGFRAGDTLRLAARTARATLPVRV